VEFAGLDEDVDEDGDQGDNNESGLQLPNPNAQKANAQRGKTLEALLATKNKRILEELTKFRVRSFVYIFGPQADSGFQILHTELESSLHSAEEELIATKTDLEKQKILNEKLENDLVSMNSHKSNGDLASSELDSTDVLAGLDLGRKTARHSLCTPRSPLLTSCRSSRNLFGQPRYPLHHPQIQLSSPSSPVNAIDSDSAMPN
jgi:homeobox protein cut-like